MALVGIDFGTWRIRAAVAAAEGWPSPDEVVEIPAVFAFHGGRITVGETVLITAGVVPDWVVRQPKRLLGRAADDPFVARLAAREGLTVAARGRGDLWIGARSDPEEPGVSLERAVATLLEHVVEMATGERAGHDVVLAVPVWFGESQRQALLAAAERANLQVQRFVLDTVAAALFCERSSRTVGVVDAGAGGVGAAVVRTRPDGVTLLGAHGEEGAAGEDVVDELMAATGLVPEGSDRELLRQGTEQLLGDLESASEVSCTIELSEGRQRFGAARWELDILLAPLAERLAHACAAARDDVLIDRVVAHGGMMAHPAVREVALRRWGAVEPIAAGAVACGAAIVALACDGKHALAIVDGEERPRTSTSIPGGLGAPTSRKRSAPSRLRPEVKRRRLSTAEIHARRESVGLKPPPAAPLLAEPSQEPEQRPTPSPASSIPPSGQRISPRAAASLGADSNAPPQPGDSSLPPSSPTSASMPVWPREGTVSPPARPEELLAMPLARRLDRSDLEPVALPVLLRRFLARPGMRGTLRLEGPGVLLQFPFEEGCGLLTKADEIALRRAYDAPRLRWRIEPFASDAQRRQARPLGALAQEGLRQMLRQTRAEELEAGFGAQLDDAPSLVSARAVRRLALEPHEERFVAHHLDGSTSARALSQSSGFGRLAALQLLAMLDLHGALAWRETAQSGAPSLSDELADRADRFERSHDLAVLGLDALPAADELDEAYRRRTRAYAVGSGNDALCPEACAAIRRRLDNAYLGVRAALGLAPPAGWSGRDGAKRRRDSSG